MTREICLLLHRGIISSIESGTLGLYVGSIIGILTKGVLAAEEILEVPKPLKVLI